jgi:hypothetical protein
MRQKQINLAKKSGKKHIFQKEFNWGKIVKIIELN